MNEEMADRVERRCQDINAIFGDRWEWGKFYEDLSIICGVQVERLPKDDPLRKRFTTALRRVIREKDYSLQQVEQHKLALVEAILKFKR